MADQVRSAGGVLSIPQICPVAQALIGLGYEEVEVRYGVTVAKNHRWIVLGNIWMTYWDRGGPVTPTILELEEEEMN